MLLACAHGWWAAAGGVLLTLAGVVVLLAFLRTIDKIGDDLRRLDRQSKGR